MNTSSLSDLIAQIDSLKAELERLKPILPERLHRIREKVRLEWNYNSNAIEGNRLTLGETRALLQQNAMAGGKSFEEHRDIRGHDRAIGLVYDMVARGDELTEAAIRELHRVMLVEEYEIEAITPDGKKTLKHIKPGEYKRYPNCVMIGGKAKVYALPEDAPAQLRDLIEWYRNERAEKKNHPLFVASILHRRFTAIHPFDDGNGRMARLLLNFALMQHDLPPIVLSVQEREQYIEALRAADASQDEIAQLTRIIGHSLLASLDMHCRGARGEAIEEITDLDKEMLLLRHQLGRRPEPEPRSALNVQKALEHSIFPLMTRLCSKLAEFDDYFAKSGVFVAGGVSARTGVRTLGGQALEPIHQETNKAELLSFLRSFSGREIHNLVIQFNWRNFKKGNLNVFDYGDAVSIEFQELKFRITVAQHTGSTKTVEQWYQQEIGEDAIRELTDHIRRPFVKRIKQAIGAQ